MAKSQAQGLQIALVVFIVLTLMLSVATYLFYDQGVKTQEAYAAELAALKKAEEAAERALENLDILVAAVGFAELGPEHFGTGAEPPDPHGPTVLARVLYDLRHEQDESYNDALTRLEAEANRLKQEITKKRQQYEELKNRLAQKRAEEKAQRDKFKNLFDEAKQQLAQVQEETDRKYQAQVQEHQSMQDEANRAKRKEKELERLLAATKNKLTRQIKELREQRNVLRELGVRAKSVGEPVGKIVRVEFPVLRGRRTSRLFRIQTVPEAPQGFAYINLGHADLLRPQTTFSVWEVEELERARALQAEQRREAEEQEAAEPGERQKATQTEKEREEEAMAAIKPGPKGHIEVLEIIGPHLSKARITMNQLGRPIRPGDVIFSPIFKPGERRRFALVGDFDLPGGGTKERDLLIYIIEKQGGIVEAYVDDKGVIHADDPETPINPRIDWLVIGSLPDPVPDYITEKFIEPADKFGVEIIDQDKLYSYLGINPRALMLARKERAVAKAGPSAN